MEERFGGRRGAEGWEGLGCFGAESLGGEEEEGGEVRWGESEKRKRRDEEEFEADFCFICPFWNQRQFSRLLEMLLLQYLDEDDKVAVKGYRLYVRTLFASRRLDALSSPLVQTLTPPSPSLSHSHRSRKDSTASTSFVHHPSLHLVHVSKRTEDSTADPLLFARRSASQEILSQLKPKERKEKLEETFKAVKEDYERILERARLD